MTITDQTRKNSVLPKDFLTKFDLREKSRKSYKVNSFKQLGMADPFPTESVQAEKLFKIPSTIDKLVYDEERVSRHNYAPTFVFIPTQEIMFKLIRACICTKYKEDLWFNNIII